MKDFDQPTGEASDDDPPSDRSGESIRIESARHQVDGPLNTRTLQLLTDEQLRELKEIVTYELSRLTKSLGKV